MPAEKLYALISSTVLEEKFVLRAAIVNHRSRREDFQMLVEAVGKIEGEIGREFGKCAKTV